MERNSYFDFIRGGVILMVVAIHTFMVTGESRSLQLVQITLREMMNCAVPVFFALSGFFLANKKLDERESRKQFWGKQIPKIYIPCLIWSIPWFLFSLHSFNINVLLKELFLVIICGQSIYYFIAVIIQDYLLLPVLQKKKDSKICLLIIALVSFALVFFTTWLNVVKGLHLPLIVFAGPFPLWLVFFFLGMYLSTVERKYSPWLVLLMSIVALCIQVVETQYLLDCYGGGYGIKLSSFLFSFLFILLLFSKRIENKYVDNKFGKIMGMIGKKSLGIYLSHILISTMIMRFVHIHSWLIMFIIVLFLDFVLLFLSNKILPKKILVLIGFE